MARLPVWPRGARWVDENTIIIGTNSLTTGLLRVPAGGGEPTVLTTPDRARGEEGHVLPSRLPGGHGVLFTIGAAKPENAQIALLDLQTGTQTMCYVVVTLACGVGASSTCRPRVGRHAIRSVSRVVATLCVIDGWRPRNRRPERGGDRRCTLCSWRWGRRVSLRSLRGSTAGHEMPIPAPTRLWRERAPLAGRVRTSRSASGISITMLTWTSRGRR